MKHKNSSGSALTVKKLLVASCFAGSAASAQSLESTVTGSAGGVAVAGGVCLSYTLGEAIVDGATSAGTVLTAGFQQPSSYDHWSAGKILTQGPLADPDGDGVVNLLEFAFGTDPLSAASQAGPSVSVGPGGKILITMPKGSAAGDLIWSAEVSTDLQSWSTPGITVVLNDATTFSALYTGNAPAFLRLRIGLSGPK